MLCLSRRGTNKCYVLVEEAQINVMFE